MKQASQHKESVQGAYENYDLKATAPEARKPSIQFAFHFPELLARFREADAVAGRARDHNRRLGIAGIVLVLFALLYAAWAPLLQAAIAPHPAEPRPAGAAAPVDYGPMTMLGVTVAGLGLGGTVMGLAGLRRASARRRWLAARFTTETLRLFHFRYIASRVADIETAAHRPELQAAYVAERLEAFRTLERTVIDDERAGFDASIGLQPWDPFAPVVEQVPVGMATVVDDLSAAWRAIRFDWQLTYCNAKLSHDRTGGRMSSLQQEHAFSRFGWLCIGVVVVLHVVFVVVQLRHGHLAWLEPAVLSTALLALAARALEDGLKPQREVERYEQYRANIAVARQRLDAEPRFETKLEIIRAFEQVSLEEMRTFLRTHATARYLL
jgi:hypothetical protein